MRLFFPLFSFDAAFGALFLIRLLLAYFLQEFYWWAFSSTTKKLGTLANAQFAGTSGTRTVFNVELLSGVDIQSYSIFQGEAGGRGAHLPGHQVQGRRLDGHGQRAVHGARARGRAPGNISMMS